MIDIKYTGENIWFMLSNYYFSFWRSCIFLANVGTACILFFILCEGSWVSFGIILLIFIVFLIWILFYNVGNMIFILCVLYINRDLIYESLPYIFHITSDNFG